MRESAPTGERRPERSLFERYVCLGCGFLHDEALGLPGIAVQANGTDLVFTDTAL